MSRSKQGANEFLGLTRQRSRLSSRFEIVWPEHRFVTPEQIIEMANHDVEDDQHDGPPASNLKEALNILLETESVKFAEPLVY